MSDISASASTLAVVPTAPKQATLLQCMLSGAMAGTAVDTALFPLDTLKTRLQSKAGFAASGGFRGVYSGLTSAVIGSAPGASMFFVTYEGLKKTLTTVLPDPQYAPVVHMMSASGGEIAACFVRVPTEVIKQRMQTKQFQTTSAAVKSVIHNEGILGFYRGYFSTVAREIPFTCIQFPLYEYMKKTYAHATQRKQVDPWEAAICGSIAGGIAAGITTPLDVIKTRLMLSQRNATVGAAGAPNAAYYSGIIPTFKRILAEEGPRALFSGIGPRVMWISIGGSIFLGVYEKAKVALADRD
ncbi:solute carrier family 25 (mitochondrial S-adenosylmethionine transporter), member 26 [Entomortierella parvispora]|uniref:Solute carrier family 25 (Mitochondrial S-adenosylmethionine transporter), member 26 n=1 Tax=Entomortierella parvispora TaxID=205924 RepID=A0A9P3HI70_9FUNG|nr:solute carrier family 25 (mitochondrial S-adenosylmethionine transporter), member 26 [Entomortierella parvispora]